MLILLLTVHDHDPGHCVVGVLAAAVTATAALVGLLGGLGKLHRGVGAAARLGSFGRAGLVGFLGIKLDILLDVGWKRNSKTFIT